MEFNLDWLLATDYTEPVNFLTITGILWVGIFLRYLALAWIYHELVYKKMGDSQPYRRLHQQIKLDQVKREIWYSFLGSLIFSVAGTFLLICWQRGWTQLYTIVAVWDLVWIPVGFFSALFLHETYYYWLHRWMHKPKVLHRFHHIHHNSLYTSSFTSFSFHPIEAGLQAIFLPVLVLVLPMNFFVLIALLITMSVTAVINHSGLEVYPGSEENSVWTRWIIGATHHDQHHLRYRCNYGLYFTFWDRWMGTEDGGFSERFLNHTFPKRLESD